MYVIPKFNRISTFGVKQAFSDELQERLIREMDEQFIYYQNLNKTKIKVFVHHTQLRIAMDKWTKVIEAFLEGPLAIHLIKLNNEHESAKKQVEEEFLNNSLGWPMDSLLIVIL